MEATVIIQATVKKSNVKFNFEVFLTSNYQAFVSHATM